VTGSVATATSKAPRSAAAAVESQQVAVATTVVVGAECGPDTNQLLTVNNCIKVRL
jgi:hypothetical protein